MGLKMSTTKNRRLSTGDSELFATKNGKTGDDPPHHRYGDARESDEPKGSVVRFLPPVAKQEDENKDQGGGATSRRNHLTDVGNGKRLIERHGHGLRYCWPWSKWLYWDGRRWAVDTQGAVCSRAKETITALYQWAVQKVMEIAQKLKEGEGDELKRQQAAANAMMNFCLKSEGVARIKAMVDLARSEDGIPVQPGQLDQDPFLLSVLNGTIDLRTGVLRPHDRNDMITKLAPVVYDSRAEAPQFQEFLRDIFDDDSAMIQYIQRRLGYYLTGDVSEQDLEIWFGTGCNGKSVLINILIEVLGPDYGMKAAKDLLLAKHGERHPTEIADLHGKRFVACLETDDGRRLAESLVKDLTGGDRVRARRMREDHWEFTPTHKLILCTNHKPAISGTDHAIWRRVRLIPFKVTIPEAKKDPKLLEKLKRELPGILAWCVQGCLQWQREGLGIPEVVQDATKDYRAGQDVLGAFIQDCCLQGPDYRIKSGDLYAAYTAWSKQSGEREVSARKFGEAMTERQFERQTSNGTWYLRVAVRPDPEPSDGTLKVRS